MIMSARLAPVKVNLCLHVGGVRPDGYHELLSLAVFPKAGDMLKAELASEFSLSISGAYKDHLKDVPLESNLIIKAARLLQDATSCTMSAKFSLEKNIPAASGVGGGTSDAACALILLRELWQISISDEDLLNLSFKIGADGPVCLWPYLYPNQACQMAGAGETVLGVDGIPSGYICLINPLVEVPTGEVFKSFDAQYPEPILKGIPHFVDWRSFEQESANDLQAIAIKNRPVIAEVLDFLSQQPLGQLVRMSGSGATCFAIFDDEEAACETANKAMDRGWWSLAARF